MPFYLLWNGGRLLTGSNIGTLTTLLALLVAFHDLVRVLVRYIYTMDGRWIGALLASLAANALSRYLQYYYTMLRAGGFDCASGGVIKRQSLDMILHRVYVLLYEYRLVQVRVQYFFALVATLSIFCRAVLYAVDFQSR